MGDFTAPFPTSRNENVSPRSPNQEMPVPVSKQTPSQSSLSPSQGHRGPSLWPSWLEQTGRNGS